MRSMATQIRELVQRNEATNGEISKIYLEEINHGVSRLGQKTLDGAHFILMDEFERHGMIDRVSYIDSDGAHGWRSRLGLKLNDYDKEINKKHKAINKRKKKGTPDLIIITKKHLAMRYVNAQLGTTFNVDENPTDNDAIDAIGLGLAVIEHGLA